VLQHTRTLSRCQLHLQLLVTASTLIACLFDVRKQNFWKVASNFDETWDRYWHYGPVVWNVKLPLNSWACSAAHRSNRPDHWDGLMLDRSAVGQLSSLSSRTKLQRLPAGDTLRSVSPAGSRCHFVLLDNDESCPTADLSNIRPSQWSSLFDRWAVEHAPGSYKIWWKPPF